MSGKAQELAAFVVRLEDCMRTLRALATEEPLAEVRIGRAVAALDEKVKEFEQEVRDWLGERETVHTLRLDVRSYNCLLRAGIITVPSLTQTSAVRLLKIEGLGTRSLKVIRQALGGIGLALRGEKPPKPAKKVKSAKKGKR